MLAIVRNDEEFTIKADDLENKEWIQNYFICREPEIMRMFSTQRPIPLISTDIGLIGNSTKRIKWILSIYIYIFFSFKQSLCACNQAGWESQFIVSIGSQIVK